MFKPKFLRAKPAGPVTGEEEKPVTDWTQNLIFFFRIMALIQLAKGMVHWGLLISPTDTLNGPIGAEYLTTNIYFAVLDPVAGVGLWLTSSWGSVMWLLAAVSQIAICIGFPEIFGEMWWLIGCEAVAIIVYVILTLKVAQVADD